MNGKQRGWSFYFFSSLLFDSFLGVSAIAELVFFFVLSVLLTSFGRSVFFLPTHRRVQCALCMCFLKNLCHSWLFVVHLASSAIFSGCNEILPCNASYDKVLLFHHYNGSCAVCIFPSASSSSSPLCSKHIITHIIMMISGVFENVRLIFRHIYKYICRGRCCCIYCMSYCARTLKLCGFDFWFCCDSVVVVDANWPTIYY